MPPSKCAPFADNPQLPEIALSRRLSLQFPSAVSSISLLCIFTSTSLNFNKYNRGSIASKAAAKICAQVVLQRAAAYSSDWIAEEPLPVPSSLVSVQWVTAECPQQPHKAQGQAVFPA